MPYSNERVTVNQRLQFGAEATTALGTNVAASKLLECFDITLGIAGDVLFFRPTGHKYDTIQEENEEWVDGTLTGTLDYNGVLYPLAGTMGSAIPIAHGASVTAKDWIFTPPVISPSVVPQTYTIEQGDSIRAHKINYGLFTDFGYKGTRKDFTCSAKLIGQPLSDGITMTASPVAVPIAPVVSKHVNVYLDSTSAALGTTQLTRVLSVDYSMGGIYGPLWVINRSTIGWTAHVDLVPKATVKLKVEADAAGMALLGYLQSGATYWLRVAAVGTTAIASDNPGNIFNTFQHDMAVKLNKPASTFQDDQGVFAIEWEMQIVEDPTWGKSQLFTVTNLIGVL